MNNTQQQFFSLLRSGLWDIPVDPELFAESIDWDAILKMATMQTVSGVLYDGLNKLPPDKQPPTAWMRKLYQTVVRIEQSHELLNKRLVEIVSLLQSEHIDPVLLKGQGVAQNYPNPVRRQCGDIDLYIGRKDYAKACEMAQKRGMVSEEDERESHKHYHFNWNGVTIELHRIAAERLQNPFCNKRFQEWCKQLLHGDELRVWNLNNTEIQLPPVNFDALYIFNHTYHHFLTQGVGFRQLCDWARYLHTFEDQIDREKLFHNLKSFGLLRVWQIFGCIIVNNLGLAADKFPCYADTYKEKSQRIVSEHIMQTGNFGFYDPNRKERSSGYLSGKLQSLWIHTRRARHLFSIIPVEVALRFPNFLMLGIRQIIREKFKPKA